MAKEKAPNYTPAQEARIREAAPMNLAKATALALEFGKTPKSVVAKANSLGVVYEKKTRTAKDGSEIVKKTELVSEIAARIGVEAKDLESLANASKASLVKLLGSLAVPAADVAEMEAAEISQ